MTERVKTERAVCPSCGIDGPFELIFRAGDIPVHSCILIDSQSEATGFQTGNLVLGMCHACGVASNLRFDSGLIDYDTSYEETQIHSPTFGSYARTLAGEWLERYDLAGAHVVEIGCGQGEFLQLLLDLGAGFATGIDPACRPVDSGRMKLINGKFSPDLADIGGDFIFCRHTLEHILPTGELLEQIHAYLGPESGVPVCFEVPDFDRVLDECAFWDIYYEHCSYFTAQSLERLFRHHGFEIQDLRLVYAGQYLIIETKQAAAKALADPSGIESRDLATLLDKARTFAERTDAICGTWLKRIASWRKAGKKIALWGSGSKAVGFMTGLGLGDEVVGVVDINPAKQGKYMPGCRPKIMAPAELVTIQPDVIVIMNPIYLDEIRTEVAGLNLAPEFVPLYAEEGIVHG